MEKKYRLPKEFAAKWLEAMRSGRYRQGKSSLSVKEADGGFSFCCIGVACAVTGAKPDDLLDTSSTTIYNVDDLPDAFKGMPKEMQYSEFGLKPEEKLSRDMILELTRMNDGTSFGGQQMDQPKTFGEIADWIEQNVAFY